MPTVAQADDRKLPRTWPELPAGTLEACRRGDYDAFARLFAAHKDRVYSIALRFSGDEAAAADITQDVFLKLLGQIGSFRAEAKFETWLYRLVVNACLDHQRARRRWLPLLGDWVEQVRGTLLGAERLRLRDQVRTRVERAVAGLPDDQRMAVALRYTEGLSYEEIAEVTGVAVGTVASRLNRAHKQLEGKLHDLKGGLA